jgi:PAS domain S-box-containing protein
MAAPPSDDGRLKALRELAEARFRGRHAAARIPAPDTAASQITHELEVHQVELEIQNESLREAQQLLERSREWALRLFHQAPIGYLVLDSVGLVLQVNETFCRMAGRPVEALAGRPLAGLMAEKDAEVFRARLAAIFKSPAGKLLEAQMSRADGSTFQALLEAAAVRSPFGGDPETGDLVLLLTVSDVTEQRLLESRLSQAQRMESVGRLAGGVAHDFNNKLQVIIGHTEMAQAEMGPDHPLAESLDEVKAAADHAADLTRQLLAFARKQTVVPRRVDLNDVVTGTQRMLSRLVGDDVCVEWHPRPGVWPVNVDPGQMEQVLACLVLNARDALARAGGGAVVLAVENAEFTAENRPLAMVAPGSYVRLTVADSGVGMDREALEHVFEPFYTSRELGFGTGLGLSTVYGIVKQNDGYVAVDSAPGRGTTVTVLLPRADAPAARVAACPDAAGARAGRETILLVEDEEPILALCARFLRREGYHVLVARSAEDAIVLSEGHAGTIDLLVTDVILPAMNGRVLESRLRAARPSLASLFLSGYTREVMAGADGGGEHWHFLQKPFSMEEFSSRVKDALHGA